MNVKKIFTDRSHFEVFILGIFSGMPIVILYSTLFTWLAEEKIDLSVITSFAIAKICYSLKPFWAPLVDQLQIPLLSKIGRRKSWMILCAGGITLVLLLMANSNPSESLSEFYYLTFALAACSATFDIVYDAFRIEKFEPEMQALAAANSVVGYRIGMLISGAGALYLADFYNWKIAFWIMALIFTAGCFFIIIFATEKKHVTKHFSVNSIESWKELTVNPFIDFFKKDSAIIILLAVMTFKLGESMLGTVAMPFYIELGFSKTEIANVTKVFGLIATIVGSYLGGLLMVKIGVFRTMILTAIAQSVTNLTFVWLNHAGHDINVFTAAIAIENITGGMGSGALVGYLSILCNLRFTATQYALLSAMAGLPSRTIVAYSGKLVQYMGWDLYFVMTVFLAIPGILLFMYLHRKHPSQSNN